ncbi:MAG: glycosyltransferase family 4 protein [Micrococcales bacterium]|nr:glycosyltransferase family 4 protein [Micrococcales bacterium]
MRIFIWHGYLLHGTGSNEYTRALARTLAGQGHQVTVFSQDPDAAQIDLGGAVVVRPSLPGRLPVFVLDRYPDMEPALLGDCSREELDAFVEANAAALRDHGPADLLIANHVLLGAPVAAASGLPSLVKAHGSELEYAMRANSTLCQWAARSLQQCLGVIAGSEHIKAVVTDLGGTDPQAITVIPPGVDTDFMRPLPREQALAGLLAEARADVPGGERLPDPGNAGRFAQFLRTDDHPCVVYVGKLSHEKGVPLLVDVLTELDFRAVVVGFGPARAAAQAAAGDRILFTGPLQHRHLRYLWPLMDVSVVPSVFPEAFGMVAAEAAACGCPPLVADHSGLAEVAAGLRRFYPPGLRDITTFPGGDAPALARKLQLYAGLDPSQRAELAAAARVAAVELWSWDTVAHHVIEAADL